MSFVLTAIVIYSVLMIILMLGMNLAFKLDRHENVRTFVLFTIGGIVYVLCIRYITS